MLRTLIASPLAQMQDERVSNVSSCALLRSTGRVQRLTERERQDVHTVKRPAPNIPVALSSGTVWYGDSNYTSIVPFNTSTHAFGKAIPDPTAIPYSSSTVVYDMAPEALKGMPLAPSSLASDANGNLWGVGTAEKRLGFTGYASTSAIVEYTPTGSSRAFSVPSLYMRDISRLKVRTASHGL